MNSEGYPTAAELKKIREWRPEAFPRLIEFMTVRWAYPTYLRQEILKDDLQKHTVLDWHVSTAGWSGNESMVNALMQNDMFVMLWHYSWHRGGHYVFRIDPFNVGFHLVGEYCKKNGVSRQSVYQQPNKFEWYRMSPNKVFIRTIKIQKTIKG